MPELPEVQTVVNQLKGVIRGQRVVRLEIRDRKLASLRSRRIKGLLVEDVLRVGKQIVFVLRARQGAELYLAVHLRMTGRLLWSVGDGSESAISANKHLRAVLWCECGCLYFVDPRRFGTMLFSKDLDTFRVKGIDPVSAEFTKKQLRALLVSGNQEIKPWLLRQDRLLGLGNIYVCEILYRARIGPHRRTHTLTSEDISRLFLATKQVLARAIENCGTTFSDFQGIGGDIGGYQRFLRVYHREGELCRRCDQEILREKQQGRSTYFCSGCQR